MSWHAALVVGLLAIGFCVSVVLERRAEAQNQRALRDLAAATVELQQLRQRAARDAGLGAYPLAAAAQIDAVVRDIGRFASERAVRVASLQVAHENDSERRNSRLRLTLNAGGEYGAIKSWIAELLARYPSLALQSLNMRGASAANGHVEVALTFVVFVKGSR